MFILTPDACLIQYLFHDDMWVFHRSIFLSHRYSFEYIDYDIEYERFVLKSKKFPDRLSKPDVIFYLALFNVAPLSFIGILSLTKSLFGYIKDAYITNGLIVLLINTTYYFYDLDEIINLFCTNYLEIERSYEPLTEGLLQNITIRHLPTLLYQISVKDWKKYKWVFIQWLSMELSS